MKQFREFVMHFDMHQPINKLVFLALKETSRQTGYSKEDILFSLVLARIIKSCLKGKDENIDLNLLKNCIEVDMEA